MFEFLIQYNFGYVVLICWISLVLIRGSWGLLILILTFMKCIYIGAVANLEIRRTDSHFCGT